MALAFVRQSALRREAERAALARFDGNVSIGEPAQIIRPKNLAPSNPPSVNSPIAAEIPEIHGSFQISPSLADGCFQTGFRNHFEIIASIRI